MKKINIIFIVVLLSLFILPKSIYAEEVKLLGKLKVANYGDSWYNGTEIYGSTPIIQKDNDDNIYLSMGSTIYNVDRYFTKMEERSETKKLSNYTRSYTLFFDNKISIFDYKTNKTYIYDLNGNKLQELS